MKLRVRRRVAVLLIGTFLASGGAAFVLSGARLSVPPAPGAGFLRPPVPMPLADESVESASRVPRELADPAGAGLGEPGRGDDVLADMRADADEALAAREAALEAERQEAQRAIEALMRQLDARKSALDVAETERGSLRAVQDEIQQSLGHRAEMRAELEAMAAILRTATPDLTVYRSGDALAIALADSFVPNAARLSPDQRDTLAALAAAILQGPGLALTIEGHTDAARVRSRERDNHDLGFERARAVHRALLDGGVPADRMMLMSCGEHRPVVEAALAAENRRVEVLLHAPRAITRGQRADELEPDAELAMWHRLAGGPGRGSDADPVAEESIGSEPNPEPAVRRAASPLGAVREPEDNEPGSEPSPGEEDLVEPSIETFHAAGPAREEAPRSVREKPGPAAPDSERPEFEVDGATFGFVDWDAAAPLPEPEF